VNNVARLCERPGCSDPADLAYGFDVDRLMVWLDALHVAQGARSGVLCRRHALSMVVPLGWAIDDRREPVPRLFVAPDAPVEPATALPGANRRKRPPADVPVVDVPPVSATALQLQLDDVAPIAESEDEVSGEPAATHDAPVEPWKPSFDQSDDLSGLLKARGRLLSRAFNGSTGSN